MATQQLRGFEDLHRKLRRLGARAGGQSLRAAAMQATLPAFREAKANAPVGTEAHKTYKGRIVAPGFGQRSVARKSRLSRDRQTVWVMIGVKPEAFYMVQFVELGTSKMPKAPWLEPAFRRSQNDVIERFGVRLRRQIDKARR